MNKVLYACISLLVLTSCVDSYNIQGTSNMSTLDGRMLYLKILKNNDFKSIDSSEVVHGQFHFAGTVDSVRMATIFMDSTSVMPVVLESGDISIKIDNAQQTVTGTPLNDKLFKFFNKWNQLKNQQAELVHRHDQAIMNGRDMNVVNAQLNDETVRISKLEDNLITGFVNENFDNVLGPGVFFMLTAGNPYPELTPWIEDIMSKATDSFKNNPYVKDYYQKAQENEQIMNGMRDIPSAALSVQPQQPATASKPAPTPNELGSPAPQ